MIDFLFPESEMDKIEITPSKSQVNAAGKLLRSHSAVWSDEIERAREIVAGWRSSFSYPLRAAAATLRLRAKRYDPEAIISRRLKRMPSIIGKLERQPTMALTTMQDIAGCRAVLKDIRTVHIFNGMRLSRAKDDEEFDVDDYLSHPKEDGYRSVHIIQQFKSKNPAYACFNGKKIEIQIRSRLQHAWATAVETVDTFDKQGLKFGRGEANWKRFFALASSGFAILEQTAPVPNTPTGHMDLLREIDDYEKTMRVFARLTGWTHAMRMIKQTTPPLDAGIYVLDLDISKFKLEVIAFRRQNVARANFEYERLEREYKNNPDRDVVLVGVDSLATLADAYPNYYADTREFVFGLECVLYDIRPEIRDRMTKDGRSKQGE